MKHRDGPGVNKARLAHRVEVYSLGAGGGRFAKGKAVEKDVEPKRRKGK